jgi:hypothetical protein
MGQMFGAAKKSDEWVSELLNGPKKDEADPQKLAKKTGLKVKL